MTVRKAISGSVSYKDLIDAGLKQRDGKKTVFTTDSKLMSVVDKTCEEVEAVMSTKAREMREEATGDAKVVK